jgi:hypothetical protein
MLKCKVTKKNYNNKKKYIKMLKENIKTEKSAIEKRKKKAKFQAYKTTKKDVPVQNNNYFFLMSPSIKMDILNEI